MLMRKRSNMTAHLSGSPVWRRPSASLSPSLCTKESSISFGWSRCAQRSRRAYSSSTAAAQKFTSIYTSTSAKACRTIESHPDEAGWYRGRCKGVGGYALDLTEGDLRQSLDVITPAKKKFELNFTSFYSSFSAIGDKV